MITRTCGCSSETCGCCEGTQPLTPVSTVNRPGLDALSYRVGTHGSFLETMKARLATMTVQVPGVDGKTITTSQPLRGLTTRDTGDPAVALLDSWATVGDVLTFYQERIANEGYLRTATERRSILELARLVGYTLRPGVAATVYLAYTLDDNQQVPVDIPAGARSQSVPGPGELPQSFETSEELVARIEWNNLKVRLTQPQNITLENAAALGQIYVSGTNTNLKTGDSLLLVFGGENDTTKDQPVVRKVISIESQTTGNRTNITLSPMPALIILVWPSLVDFVQQLQAFVNSTGSPAGQGALAAGQEILANSYSGLFSSPLVWAQTIRDRAKLTEGDNSLEQLVKTFENEILRKLTPLVLPLLAHFVQQLQAFFNKTKSKTGWLALATARAILADSQKGPWFSPLIWGELILRRIGDSAADPALIQLIRTFQTSVLNKLKNPFQRDITDPSQFVSPLLQPRVPQAPSSLQLSRSVAKTFEPGADVLPQLLVNFAPALKDTFYDAWSSANVGTTPSPLKAVYALRVQASLFGASAPQQFTPPNTFVEWPIDGSEGPKTVFLDQAYVTILPGRYVVIENPNLPRNTPLVRQVSTTQTVQRTAYGISGKTTRLDFDTDWWELPPPPPQTANTPGSPVKTQPVATDSAPGPSPLQMTMATLRSTLVYGPTEELMLVDAPLSDPVQTTVDNQEVPLDQLYNGLTSGRWVIFSGERADIPGVTGVQGSELLMISGLRQDLPGAKTRTTLVLATPTAYSYKRDNLTIYGNVVKATHGETRNETLGSGDGSQPLQSFALKQKPLTFVPAPTPSGADSTLQVYVNNVQWHEAETLAGLGPKDRNFITKTDDQDTTSVIFGNGEEGARLPTGLENVNAVYRNGIGQPGNVAAGQISTLQTRPLGVKGVINPLPASGGADRENRDQSRENAPLAVMSLDRLVSLQDYADFTRTFAGIGKAASRRLSDGRRELIHITIAGADDIPIDVNSDLYRNLLLALRNFGDPALPVQVDLRELKALVLSAKIKINPDYQWDPVAASIRAAVMDAFGFQKRALGQPALLCEVIGLIQNIEGVVYVDVEAFGGIPEKKLDTETGVRRLLHLDEMAGAVTDFLPQQTPVKGPIGNNLVLEQRMMYDANQTLQTDSNRPLTHPLQCVDANLADFEGGVIRPAQLVIFTPAVPDTLILNQIL